MSVQIHINGENASEAIRELSELASHFSAPKIAEPVRTDKATRNTKVNAPAPDPVKQEEPIQQEAVLEESKQEDTADGNSEEQYIPTDVELRAKATEKRNSRGGQKVKELLVKYGIPNITSLPAEKRISFMEDLEAL